MGIVTSMFLIAAGAIMRFAVTMQGHGFNVHTTGMVLMIVGAIGAVLSIGFWASWGGFGHYGRRGTVVTGQRTTVSSQSAPVQQTEREVL
jgi:hypothetical protein